ncbi:hypothetical protein WA158_006519 [Blastocystis sp. Blastoise]
MNRYQEFLSFNFDLSKPSQKFSSSLETKFQTIMNNDEDAKRIESYYATDILEDDSGLVTVPSTYNNSFCDQQGIIVMWKTKGNSLILSEQYLYSSMETHTIQLDFDSIILKNGIQITMNNVSLKLYVHTCQSVYSYIFQNTLYKEKNVTYLRELARGHRACHPSLTISKKIPKTKVQKFLILDGMNYFYGYSDLSQYIYTLSSSSNNNNNTNSINNTININNNNTNIITTTAVPVYIPKDITPLSPLYMWITRRPSTLLSATYIPTSSANPFPPTLENDAICQLRPKALLESAVIKSFNYVNNQYLITICVTFMDNNLSLCLLYTFSPSPSPSLTFLNTIQRPTLPRYTYIPPLSLPFPATAPAYYYKDVAFFSDTSELFILYHNNLDSSAYLTVTTVDSRETNQSYQATLIPLIDNRFDTYIYNWKISLPELFKQELDSVELMTNAIDDAFYDYIFGERFDQSFLENYFSTLHGSPIIPTHLNVHKCLSSSFPTCPSHLSQFSHGDLYISPSMGTNADAVLKEEITQEITSYLTNYIYRYNSILKDMINQYKQYLIPSKLIVFQGASLNGLYMLRDHVISVLSLTDEYGYYPVENSLLEKSLRSFINTSFCFSFQIQSNSSLNISLTILPLNRKRRTSTITLVNEVVSSYLRKELIPVGDMEAERVYNEITAIIGNTHNLLTLLPQLYQYVDQFRNPAVPLPVSGHVLSASPILSHSVIRNGLWTCYSLFPQFLSLFLTVCTINSSFSRGNQEENKDTQQNIQSLSFLSSCRYIKNEFPVSPYYNSFFCHHPIGDTIFMNFYDYLLQNSVNFTYSRRLESYLLYLIMNIDIHDDLCVLYKYISSFYLQRTNLDDSTHDYAFLSLFYLDLYITFSKKDINIGDLYCNYIDNLFFHKNYKQVITYYNHYLLLSQDPQFQENTIPDLSLRINTNLFYSYLNLEDYSNALISLKLFYPRGDISKYIHSFVYQVLKSKQQQFIKQSNFGELLPYIYCELAENARVSPVVSRENGVYNLLSPSTYLVLFLLYMKYKNVQMAYNTMLDYIIRLVTETENQPKSDDFIRKLDTYYTLLYSICQSLSSSASRYYFEFIYRKHVAGGPIQFKSEYKYDQCFELLYSISTWEVSKRTISIKNSIRTIIRFLLKRFFNVTKDIHYFISNEEEHLTETSPVPTVIIHLFKTINSNNQNTIEPEVLFLEEYFEHYPDYPLPAWFSLTIPDFPSSPSIRSILSTCIRYRRIIEAANFVDLYEQHVNYGSINTTSLPITLIDQLFELFDRLIPLLPKSNMDQEYQKLIIRIYNLLLYYFFNKK